MADVLIEAESSALHQLHGVILTHVASLCPHSVTTSVVHVKHGKGCCLMLRIDSVPPGNLDVLLSGIFCRVCFFLVRSTPVPRYIAELLLTLYTWCMRKFHVLVPAENILFLRRQQHLGCWLARFVGVHVTRL